MNSSIDNGGKTHARYAHMHYPKTVELKCKKCESKIVATNKNVPDGIEHFMDISEFEKKWNLICLNCTFRAELNWIELKKFDLWLKTEIRNIEFWSWNIDHLKMIIKKLNKVNLNSDKWVFYESYIPKNWLLKFNNEREIRKIEKLTEK
ncbi:hypothetical protein LNJ40_06915 [Tenacibaculum dicentrarchi]|nr:hypothetical protein [Tenacibaculum dicentrarchi]MCD8421258.1 hypothetical protein [Tenacibaculum dicentrarchi]MCD8425023.1 hypothetical protein [Tenacibaculum dicentrarchi]MCD8435123.1 hypothetical protein [Tenacibaculum dicentrarchi]